MRVYSGTASTWVHLLLYVVIAVALLVLLSPAIHSSNIDLASHYSLVHEFMRYGVIRPEDKYLDLMQAYPPLSHWLAALVGKVVGSGLLGLSIVSVMAIYLTYLSIVSLLVGNATAILAFAIMAGALSQTRSLPGYEVIGYFFYPQIVGFAIYFMTLAWYAVGQPGPVRAAMAFVFLVPLIYLTQPLAGVHLTATFSLIFSVELSLQWRRNRPNLRDFLPLFVLGAGTVVCFFLHPVRALISYAVIDGGLFFGFYHGWIFVPFAVSLASSLSVFLFGLRDDLRIERITGGAGIAAAMLMTLQWVMLHGLGAGSSYAIKKHLFVVMALGTINLARLIARKLRFSIPYPYRPLLTAVMAASACLWIYRGEDIPVAKVDAAEDLATRFAGSDQFRSGNTAVFIASMPEAISIMVAHGAFNDSIDRLFKQPDRIGAATHILADFREDMRPCADLVGGPFAVVSPPSCMWNIQLGGLIAFGNNDIGASYLAHGWHQAESWGAWGMQDATLAVRLPKASYRLTVKAIIPAFNLKQTFSVLVDQTKVADWAFTPSPSEQSIDIPASVISGDISTIQFVGDLPLMSPVEAGYSSDARKLGIGLVQMELERLP